MFNIDSKIVIIDKDIIDNQIYTIIDSIFDYSKIEIYYIVSSNENKIIFKSDQIRQATQIEIDNGIKFDPIKVKTIVAYNDLLKPSHLMEVLEYNEKTLDIKAFQHYSKITYDLNLVEVRPAKLNEINSGHRITTYNKELYLSYCNPFMIYDLYHIDQPQNIVYKNRFEQLKLIVDGSLTINGERLHNDIDFEYLLNNKYDLDSVSNETTHIATNKDGSVIEFKLNSNSSPMYDEVNGKWFIVETEDEYIISVNKIIGMMSVSEYTNSLIKIK